MDGLIAFFRVPPSEDRLGHTHLSIHPLETAILLGHVRHLGDQGRIYHPAGFCCAKAREGMPTNLARHL